MKLTFQEKPYLITNITEHISEDKIKSFFGDTLNDKMVEFWQEFAEIGFNNVNVFGFEIAKEMNLINEVGKYAPDFIMVGITNGGEGVFIKKDFVDINVFYLDMGALGTVEMRSLGVNFFQWIQNGPSLEDKEIIDYLGYIDLYVTKSPENIVQFIVDVRRSLEVTTSISELKRELNSIPFLLKERIYFDKYANAIESINTKYGCLEVVRVK